MSVKIDKGASTLEQKAIDARLDKLGVTPDPYGEVFEPDAARSKVKDGLAGLEKVSGGKPLGLDELDKVETQKTLGSIVSNALARVTGGEARAAHDTVRSAILTLQETAEQIEVFAKRTSWDYDQILAMFRRFGNLGNVIANVTDPKVLGHASRSEVNSIRAAYAQVLAAFSSQQQRMLSVLNDTIVPWVNENVRVRNDVSERVASRANVLTYEFVMSDVDSRLRAGSCREVVRHVDNYSEYVSTLLNNAKLFA